MSEEITEPIEHSALLQKAVQRMFVLRPFMRFVNQQMRFDAKDPDGIGEGQYQVLTFLVENPVLSVGELAQRSHVAEPTISRMLNSLETAGYIERRINPANRRAIQVSLTTKGRELQTQVATRFTQALSEALSKLTPQQLNDIILAFNHLETLINTTGNDIEKENN